MLLPYPRLKSIGLCLLHWPRLDLAFVKSKKAYSYGVMISMIWCNGDSQMDTLCSIPKLSSHFEIRPVLTGSTAKKRPRSGNANANTLRIGRLPWLVVRRAISASTTGGKWRLVTRDWRIASATDSFKISGHVAHNWFQFMPSWADSMDLKNLGEGFSILHL